MVLAPTPSRSSGCAITSGGFIQPLGALQTPGVVGIGVQVAIDLLGRGGGFVQLRVQSNAVVEDKTLALPVFVGIGQGLKVVQHAAVQLINIQPQTVLHPATEFFAAYAARAVHGHTFALVFPLLRMRLNIGRKVAEVIHARVNSAVEMTEFEFKTVAVVEQHHIVLRDEFAPGLGTQGDAAQG